MKALFFLRHYNDIDHITPLIHKWVESRQTDGHNSADVVLMGDREFMQDYRLAYLSGLENVRVAWIGEILSRSQLIRMGIQKLALDRNFRAIAPGILVNLIDRILNKERRQIFWRKIASHLLDRSFGASSDNNSVERNNRGLVAFDWISGNSVFPIEYVKTVVDMARDRNLGTVSLPHGDSPHANYLVRTDEFSMAPRKKFEPAKMFDKIVVPNELCATRFRPFVDAQNVAVLGSPRYCNEWLEKLKTLLPPSPIAAAPGKLKLVMFLRKSDFSIFWEEVERVIQMLAGFPEVSLIIKAHTRGGWRQPLFKNKNLLKLENVTFVAGEVHSSHLLEWADAIIDIATSVAFEAVKLKKPVMAADYLHASISTVAHYLPDCAWHCRDDAYRMTERLIKNGCEDFYDEAKRQQFLSNIIDVPDPEVLTRYLVLLESLVTGEIMR